MLTVQFTTPWNVFTPALFRYLKSEYVEAFFEDGSLKLSSFTHFATHADEQRHDASEGSASVIHRTDDGGGQTIAARAVLGQNAYVLCGSTHHDLQLMKAFDCDSYIRIENPMAFGQAVAWRIAGFAGRAEGLCLYQHFRGIEGDLGFVNVMHTARSYCLGRLLGRPIMCPSS